MTVHMLAVKGLTKWYEGSDRPAVVKLSFKAKVGEIVGVLGTNGAGKTTTLSIIAGLLPPTSGDVTVSGYSVSRDPLLVKKRIGYMPENPHLYERLTGWEFLRLIIDLRGVDRGKGERFMSELGEYIELYDRLDDFVSTYSKGMIQKLAFMAAVGHRPKVLLLDEPLSGIDPVASRKMREWVRGYAKKGHTVLLSTHIIDLAQRMCDHVIIIHEGSKVEAGTIPEIVERAGVEHLEDAFIHVIGRNRRANGVAAAR